MSINHDLSNYPAWLCAKEENRKDGDILFLHLKNRFEVFDEDAEILESFGVQISRINPRGFGEIVVPACRVYFDDFEELCKKIIGKCTMTIAKEIIVRRK